MKQIEISLSWQDNSPNGHGVPDEVNYTFTTNGDGVVTVVRKEWSTEDKTETATASEEDANGLIKFLKSLGYHEH